ncbi:MAG: ATP-binding protein [Hormoscilla sp.]
MTKPKKTHLQVPSDLEYNAEVLSWFDRLPHGTIDNETWIKCKTALAEGWTNAARHGHKDLPPETPIDIEVVILPQSIEIRIFDRGPGFDFEKKLQERKAQIKPKDDLGGRGLLLIAKIADRLSYTRTIDNRNCLSLVKHCQIYREGTDADCR